MRIIPIYPGMMVLKTRSPKPTLLHKNTTELPISGANLIILLQDVLSKGAVLRFRARGLSMTPFIKDGDFVTIAPLSMEKPGVGKVVAFLQPDSGQLIIHRVIGRQADAYLIQGDNTTNQPDGLVRQADILGCVTRVERQGQPISLGLGPERYLIAQLSRRGRLATVLRKVRLLKEILSI